MRQTSELCNCPKPHSLLLLLLLHHQKLQKNREKKPKNQTVKARWK
jgi:hypothetical protein